MAISARYFDLVREMKNSYNHRLRLVESARQRGIKPTARLFATTVPTVRKWLRRFEQHGPSGLHERPRARHRQAYQTPPVVEAQLVELGKTLPTFGARRLIREFDLRIGHNALERIWREHGLLEKRRRKYPAQAGPRAHQGFLGAVPANQRGHQGSTVDLFVVVHIREPAFFARHSPLVTRH